MFYRSGNPLIHRAAAEYHMPNAGQQTTLVAFLIRIYRLYSLFGIRLHTWNLNLKVETMIWFLTRKYDLALISGVSFNVNTF